MLKGWLVAKQIQAMLVNLAAQCKLTVNFYNFIVKLILDHIMVMIDIECKG
jgi:hypothetical protein